jgi:hypothetical protein
MPSLSDHLLDSGRAEQPHKMAHENADVLEPRGPTDYWQAAEDVAMNRELLAAALGRGVERAARMDLSDARRILSNSDAVVGDVFVDDSGRITEAPAEPRRGFARWRIEAIQELADEKGPCVELYVHSNDGTNEMGLTMHIRDTL